MGHILHGVSEWKTEGMTVTIEEVAPFSARQGEKGANQCAEDVSRGVLLPSS